MKQYNARQPMKTLRILLLACFLAGCAQNPVTELATALPVSSPTPTATATSIPATATLDYSASALDETVQQKLYQAAMAYDANTYNQAVQVARSIKYMVNDGDPSTMCGPLSAAILRDAGLIDKYVDLHQFWLWKPENDPGLAELTFPADRFTKYEFRESLRTFDFKAFPLKPGDFLYIYAGPPDGSFEHMLVVDRVDEAGRAYAVTNYNTDQGFIIGEVMLYDPHNPGVGQFYTWTDLTHWQMGTTGFGGFDVWRGTALPPQPTARQIALADDIDQVITSTGREWHIFVKEVGGDVIYARRADDARTINSLIKTPVAALFFKFLELNSINPGQYQEYLATFGTNGRSYEQLLNAMLVNSEEEATNTLVQEMQGNGMNTTQTLSNWGITNMYLSERFSTARQVGLVWEKLYWGALITPQGADYILNLLGANPANDASRLRIMLPLLPAGTKFYDQREAITEQVQLIGESTLIVVPGGNGPKAYIVVILNYPGESSVSTENAVQGFEQIARLLGNYIVLSGK